MEFISSPQMALILSAALAVSEALSLIPKVKSNGIFQLFYNSLRTITGRK